MPLSPTKDNNPSLVRARQTIHNALVHPPVNGLSESISFTTARSQSNRSKSECLCHWLVKVNATRRVEATLQRRHKRRAPPSVDSSFSKQQPPEVRGQRSEINDRRLPTPTSRLQPEPTTQHLRHHGWSPAYCRRRSDRQHQHERRWVHRQRTTLEPTRTKPRRKR
jgi:hypothetical protein